MTSQKTVPLASLHLLQDCCIGCGLTQPRTHAGPEKSNVVGARFTVVVKCRRNYYQLLSTFACAAAKPIAKRGKKGLVRRVVDTILCLAGHAFSMGTDP